MSRAAVIGSPGSRTAGGVSTMKTRRWNRYEDSTAGVENRTKDKGQRRSVMTRDALIEQIAESIFLIELCEHERDEYRVQARAVFLAIIEERNHLRKENGVLRDERDALREKLELRKLKPHEMAAIAVDKTRHAAMCEEHDALHAEVNHLKELLDDDTFRKMRKDRDQLLAKVERSREKLAGITRDRNQILKERNTYHAEIERLREQHQEGCQWIDGVGDVECVPGCTVRLREANDDLRTKVGKLCDAIEADLGPIDDPDKCLCDIEVAEGVTTCSVCLARQYRAAIGERR